MPTPFEELKTRALKHWDEFTSGEKAWIRIGGGTSGQAAGADSVFDSFKSTVEGVGANANVSMVGAMGLMYMEPQVDILMPDGVRVFYGNVEPDEAKDIVTQHVNDGKPLLDRAFAYSGGDGTTTGSLPSLDSLPTVSFQKRIATRN
ncbi:uncharacterized protein METZ01_LOCUS196235, partial [marine metagenome]